MRSARVMTTCLLDDEMTRAQCLKRQRFIIKARLGEFSK